MNISVRDQLYPDNILRAYCNGYFPMAESRSGPISWYAPDPRAIIPLESFRISRSLRQKIRKRTFDIRVDVQCERVIQACAEREETWISGEIVDAYAQLHKLGYVHSVESWNEGRLVGGLYGVSLRGAFFGESMFSTLSDASKVALVYLVERLRHRGFLLLDTQFINEHIRQFGAEEIPRPAYMSLLSRALSVDTDFCDTPAKCSTSEAIPPFSA